MKKLPKIVLLSERSERKGLRTPEAQFGKDTVLPKRNSGNKNEVILIRRTNPSDREKADPLPSNPPLKKARPPHHQSVRK